MVSLSPKPSPRSHTFTLLVLLLLVILGSLYYYLSIVNPTFFKSTSIDPTTSPSPSPIIPSPSPLILPTGSQTYNFNHGKDVKGPKIQTLTINPLDPEIDSTQTITIKLTSEAPVTGATIILSTDNKEKTIDLKLKEGSDLKGTYVGSWQVDDSYDFIYAFRYILKSTGDTYDNTMSIR